MTGENLTGKKREKKRTVCVTGHKNPDTDSICSAIAYAYLKNQMDDSCNYVATRAGQVNGETQFVLDYFHMDQPLFLDNIGTRVKDMEIREVPGVKNNISIKNAWTLMRGQNVFTLPITDEQNHGRIRQRHRFGGKNALPQYPGDPGRPDGRWR